MEEHLDPSTCQNPQDSLLGKRLLRFNPEDFKAVIIDEAHHAVASTYLKILRHFKLLRSGESDATPSPIFLWGCSATFSRQDCIALGQVFDKISFSLDFDHLINAGWYVKGFSILVLVLIKPIRLCKPVFIAVNSKEEFPADSITKDEASITNVPRRNLLIYESWKQSAQESKYNHLRPPCRPRTLLEHARKSTLIFVSTVSHVHALVELFKSYGIDARGIVGKTDKLERFAVLEDFKRGKFPVLINCAILTEGANIPNIDCIILARPVFSQGLQIQMIGRGLRTHEGKDYCLIIQVIDKLIIEKRSNPNDACVYDALLELPNLNIVPTLHGVSWEQSPPNVPSKIRTSTILNRILQEKHHGTSYPPLLVSEHVIDDKVVLKFPPGKAQLEYIHVTPDIYIIGCLLVYRRIEEDFSESISIFVWDTKHALVPPSSKKKKVDGPAMLPKYYSLNDVASPESMGLVLLRSKQTPLQAFTVIQGYHKEFGLDRWINKPKFRRGKDFKMRASLRQVKFFDSLVSKLTSSSSSSSRCASSEGLTDDNLSESRGQHHHHEVFKKNFLVGKSRIYASKLIRKLKFLEWTKLVSLEDASFCTV